MPSTAIPVAPAELLHRVEHAGGRADLVVVDAREHEVEQRREHRAHPGARHELRPGERPRLTRRRRAGTTASIPSTPASITAAPPCSVGRPKRGPSSPAPRPAPIAVPSDHGTSARPGSTAL